MTKLSAIAAITTLITCICINSHSKKSVNRAFEIGKIDGQKAGYAEIETVYKEKIDEQDKLYTQKINEQKNLYEKKIKAAAEEGFLQGQKEKQQEVEMKLLITSTEKEQKGKWNDVLFDVKN